MARDRTDGDGPAWSARLGRVLEVLHGRYAALRGLCDRQAALVEQDDPWPLLALLGERQAIVDQIARANRELEPLKRDWAAGAPALPVALREQIRNRIDAIAVLASEVAQRDEADQARLARRRDEVAERLVEIGRGRGAVAAYQRGGGGTGPSFQDTEA